MLPRAGIADPRPTRCSMATANHRVEMFMINIFEANLEYEHQRTTRNAELVTIRKGRRNTSFQDVRFSRGMGGSDSETPNGWLDRVAYTVAKDSWMH